MLHAVDREAISRDLFQGQQQVADIWVSPRRPQFSAVQAAITKYEYSPQRAEQLFQDAGWRKGSDGVLLNGRGERFVIDGRVAGAGELLQVQQATVDYWRRVGVQTDINNISPELDVSPEYRNQWTGAYWASINLVLEDLRNSLHSQLAPRPENRFAGSNRGRWMNPRADRRPCIDRACTFSSPMTDTYTLALLRSGLTSVRRTVTFFTRGSFSSNSTVVLTVSRSASATLAIRRELISESSPATRCA